MRGVALDLFLSEPDRSDKGHDILLADAMRRNGHTTLPVTAVTLSQHAPPIESLPTPQIASAAATWSYRRGSGPRWRDPWIVAGGPGWAIRSGRALGLALIGQAPELLPKPAAGLRNPDHTSIRLSVEPRPLRAHSLRRAAGHVPAGVVRGCAGRPGAGRAAARALGGDRRDRHRVGTQQYYTPMSSLRMTGAEYHANIIEMLLRARPSCRCLPGCRSPPLHCWC